MEHFTRHIDSAYQEAGTFLEVPVALVVSLCNGDTSNDTRISDDLSLAYLCDVDQQKFLQKLTSFGIAHQIVDVTVRGLSPIRHLSSPHWI